MAATTVIHIFMIFMDAMDNIGVLITRIETKSFKVPMIFLQRLLLSSESIASSSTSEVVLKW